MMIKRTMTRQERQTLEKKHHIFDVAMEMFNEYGYEQTTIRQICSEAGVTTGTFYNIYGDKLGLIRQLYINILEDSQDILSPENNADALQHPFQNIFHYFVRNTQQLGHFRTDVAQQIMTESDRIMSGTYVPYEKTGKNLLIHFLETGQQEGTVSSKLDPFRTAVYLMAVAAGCSHYWIFRAYDMSLREAVEMILIPAFSAVTDEKISWDSLPKELTSLCS